MKKFILSLVLFLVAVPVHAISPPLVSINEIEINTCGTQDVNIAGIAKRSRKRDRVLKVFVNDDKILKKRIRNNRPHEYKKWSKTVELEPGEYTVTAERRDMNGKILQQVTEEFEIKKCRRRSGRAHWLSRNPMFKNGPQIKDESIVFDSTHLVTEAGIVYGTSRNPFIMSYRGNPFYTRPDITRGYDIDNVTYDNNYGYANAQKQFYDPTEYEHTFDISELEPGTYYVRAYFKGKYRNSESRRNPDGVFFTNISDEIKIVVPEYN